MTKHVLAVVPGLDPLRVVRAAVTLGGSHLMLPITRTADHWLDDLGGVLRACGLDLDVLPIDVAEYDLAGNVAAIRTALTGLRLDPQSDVVSVVIGGGTKPIAAALGVVAEEFAAITWILNERDRVLVGGDQVVPLVEPDVNLQPEQVGRLYAVHHRITGGLSETDDETLLHWLREALDRPERGRHDRDAVEEMARTFEQAVVALVRRVVGADYDVWGPQQFVLRDPVEPERPAEDPDAAEGFTPYRSFEVDGVVVRGTTAWVLESKFIGSLKQSRMRTAFAEIDRRRRDLGGQTTTGVLVVKDDQRADETPEGPVDLFVPAGVEIISKRDLRQALNAVRSLDQARIAATELARVFAR